MSERTHKIEPPRCGCGSLAYKPTKNFSDENSILWLCKSGHTTRITYCSLADREQIPNILGETK